jgi:hypothetical protein
MKAFGNNKPNEYSNDAWPNEKIMMFVMNREVGKVERESAWKGRGLTQATGTTTIS